MASSPESSDVTRVLAALQSNPNLMRNVALWKTLEAQPARFAPFPESIAPELVAALRAQGIEQLYTHQAQAIDRILAGRHVSVVTPTASGKTLCFNLPVIQAILENPQSRALYLFPTKALSQDQMKECHALTGALDRDIKVYTYDGDTPANARRAIRTAGHIVVTNPDMLHAGILPHHTNWIKLFENLRYVVIDEIHHYRGVFGGHLANVIRRLRRIADFYGAKPVFICCSATIANPQELAQELVGEPVELVDDNGAPRGEKAIIFYNPPVVNRELGIRRSNLKEVRRLASPLLKHGVQTIVFARSRLRVEILVTYLKRLMKKLGLDPERIKGYRGGYLPLERRAIEEGIKTGSVLGVVSTNALELGIDIGRLQAAILAGYPGSISSTWQQGGRAGRSTSASVVILVASSAPLDQFIVNHPEYFLGASPESAIINPDNLTILASHVKCATFELPFEDGENFGTANPRPLLEFLDREQIVRHVGGRWHWSNVAFPAEGVSLRSPDVENFVILDSTTPEHRVLGEVDYGSAPFLIHEDAIYIHQSQTYFVERLDWDGRTAYARRVNTDYYTDAQAKSDIKVLTVDHTDYKSVIHDGDTERPDATEAPLVSKNFGEVSVQTLVAKYKKVKFETHENVGWGDIHLPQNEIQTEAYWLTFRDDLKGALEMRGMELAAGLRALASVLGNAVPIFATCDPRDFYAVPMVRAPHDQLPTIYIYDRYPGGIGLARKVFSIDRDIVRAARGIVGDCKCGAGCPSCVGPAVEVGEGGKKTAAFLLERIAAQLKD